jgi:hypothetical protein
VHRVVQRCGQVEYCQRDHLISDAFSHIPHPTAHVPQLNEDEEGASLTGILRQTQYRVLGSRVLHYMGRCNVRIARPKIDDNSASNIPRSVPSVSNQWRLLLHRKADLSHAVQGSTDIYTVELVKFV